MQGQAQGRITVPFHTVANPSEKKYMTAYKIPKDATIEEIQIRFYAGCQHDLHITPFIEKRGGGTPEYVFHNVDKSNDVTGDDDRLIYPVTIPVERDDYIKVLYYNADPNYSYHVVVDFILDFEQGKHTVR